MHPAARDPFPPSKLHPLTVVGTHAIQGFLKGGSLPGDLPDSVLLDLPVFSMPVILHNEDLLASY